MSRRTFKEAQKFPIPRQYEIKELTERHHMMIRFMSFGWGNIAIAKALDVSPQNVSDVRNSSIVKDKLAVMRREQDLSTVNIIDDLAEEAPHSLGLLKSIRAGEEDGSTLSMRKSAATDLMKMAGYGPITRVQGQFLHSVITANDLDEIKSLAADAKKMALRDGGITDADFEIEGEKNEKKTMVMDMSNTDGAL